VGGSPTPTHYRGPPTILGSPPTRFATHYRGSPTIVGDGAGNARFTIIIVCVIIEVVGGCVMNAIAKREKKKSSVMRVSAVIHYHCY
jgi:hypothetical protein